MVTMWDQRPGVICATRQCERHAKLHRVMGGLDVRHNKLDLMKLKYRSMRFIPDGMGKHYIFLLLLPKSFAQGTT